MRDRPIQVALAIILLSPSLLDAAEYQFSWALPIPQGNSLGGAAFTGLTTGFAVGARGTVIRSNDGGATWSLVELYPTFAADLNDVIIIGPGELLAVGAPPGVYRSTNDGASWSAVTIRGCG